MTRDGPPHKRLPNADLAVVDQAKLTEYLLNPDHRVSGDKAWYLSRFGFTRDNLGTCEAAILLHAREGVIVNERRSVYGRRFAVEGPLRTPDGRNPFVRTVWMLRFGEQQPRFVTAFPGRRRQEGGVR